MITCECDECGTGIEMGEEVYCKECLGKKKGNKQDLEYIIKRLKDVLDTI